MKGFIKLIFSILAVCSLIIPQVRLAEASTVTVMAPTGSYINLVGNGVEQTIGYMTAQTGLAFDDITSNATPSSPYYVLYFTSGSYLSGTITVYARKDSSTGPILGQWSVSGSGNYLSYSICFQSMNFNGQGASTIYFTAISTMKDRYGNQTSFTPTWYSQAFNASEIDKPILDAKNAAEGAQTAAQAAQDGTNTIINSYLSTSAGIVQDSSGNTALSMAKQASQNALFL